MEKLQAFSFLFHNKLSNTPPRLCHHCAHMVKHYIPQLNQYPAAPKCMFYFSKGQYVLSNRAFQVIQIMNYISTSLVATCSMNYPHAPAWQIVFVHVWSGSQSSEATHGPFYKPWASLNSRASANKLRIFISCLSGGKAILSCLISGSCTRTCLTHIWSRCSGSIPHLTQRLHSSELVNFSILHRSEFKQWSQRSKTEMSTCIQYEWSWLAALAGLCRASSDCSTTKGLTRGTAQPR